LIPYPSYREALFLNFQGYQDAVSFLSDIAKAGVFPKSAEFLEDRVVAALEAYHSDTFPFSVSPAMIMMDCEAYDETQLQYECQICEDLATQYNAKIQRMKTTAEQDQLWEYRRTISMALTQMGGEKFSEDIVVPIAQLDTCIKALNDIAASHNVVIIGYGHLGDGNIHVNCLKMTLSDSEWQAVKAKVIEKVLRLAVSLGGSITGEHGVGLSKKEHMNLMFTEKDLHVHRDLKKVWDPSGILNPGKMIG
jgi:glycolate oxidase